MDKIKLARDLRKNQRDMEDQYLVLGDLYQSFFSEFEKKYVKDLNFEGEEMSDGIQQFQETVSRLLKYLKLTHKKSCHFEELFKDCIQLLQNQRLYINTVNEYSELLEMISLNILILTIKKGPHDGLAELAHSIKDKSSEAIRITDDMNHLLEVIEDVEKNLQTGVSIFRKKNNVNSYHFGRAQSEYEYLKEIQKGFKSFYKKKDKDYRKIKPLVMSVMGELQMQDIYRQSLDHIHLFMEEDPHDIMDKKKNELHQVGFDEILCQFASPILSEIIGRMGGNIVSFNSNIDSLQNLYTRGINQRQEFLDIKDYEKVSHRTAVISLQNLLDDLINGLIAFDDDEELINSYFSKISSYLNSIKKSSLRLLTCIGEVQNIVRHGKILLKEDDERHPLIDNFNDINSIINRLEKQLFILDGSIVGLSKSRTETRKMVSSFNKRKDKLINEHDEIIKDLQRSSDLTLSLNRNSFQREFTSSEKIMHFFQGGKDVLKEFKRISNNLERLKKEFEKWAQIYYKRKEELMDELNLSDWSYNSERIDRILNRFTIHRQKLTLTHMSGMSEKEKTLNEGSITLF